MYAYDHNNEWWDSLMSANLEKVLCMYVTQSGVFRACVHMEVLCNYE